MEFTSLEFKSHSGQVSIVTSKNPSVGNTICDYLQKILIEVNVATYEGKQPKSNMTLNKR